MAYGFHRGTIHLAESKLRVDRRTGILQCIELQDLYLTGLHIDSDLSKMSTVRHCKIRSRE